MGTGPTPRKYPTRLGGRDVAALAIHTQSPPRSTPLLVPQSRAASFFLPLSLDRRGHTAAAVGERSLTPRQSRV